MDMSNFKTGGFGEEVLKIAFGMDSNPGFQKEAGFGSFLGNGIQNIAPKISGWGAGRTGAIGNFAEKIGQKTYSAGGNLIQNGARGTAKNFGKGVWNWMGKNQGALMGVGMVGLPLVTMPGQLKGMDEQINASKAQTQYWDQMRNQGIAPKYAEEDLMNKEAEDTDSWSLGEATGTQLSEESENNPLLALLEKTADEMNF